MTWFCEFSISEDAAAAYRTLGLAMTDRVNRQLAQSPRALALVGGNPLEMMYANHRHHHQFMSNVIELKAWKMLRQTASWAYRAYHSHGFSHDYFLAQYDAWIEAVRAELTPDHAAEIIPIYEALTARHAAIIAESRQEEVPAAFDDRWADRKEALIEALISGDIGGLTRWAGPVADAADLRHLYIGALAPALVEIGRRWEQGRLSVAQEHVASMLVNRSMALWFHHVLAVTTSRGRSWGVRAARAEAVNQDGASP